MRIFAEWADMYPLVSRLPPHLLSLRPPVTAAVAAAAVAECTRPRRPALSSPQQRARDHMSRDLIPHRLLRRHGSTWPGDDHANCRGMGRHVSPRFPITPTYICFLLDLCCSCCCYCCCRGVHTATPPDLKSPFRHVRRGCPRLYSHRGASAAAVLLSFRRVTTLPSYSHFFTIGEFRRRWYSPPCSTSGLRCASRSRLVFIISTSSSRARLCSNILALEAASEPTFFLQSVRKPHATCPTPRQYMDRWFGCLDYWPPAR